MDTARGVVLKGGREVPLRPREYELLLELLRHPDVPLSRRHLLRTVWKYDASVQSRTVDVHIVELRRKLERNPARPRHILTVAKVGYRLRP